jgi:hypothetical protein
VTTTSIPVLKVSDEYSLFEAKLIETSSNHRSFREFGDYFLFVIACRAMRTLHYNLCNL